MSQRLHNRLGTTGLIIAIVALVAALGGGAYAASGALTGKQKKEVEKIAKKYAGKNGATGAAGPQGASGPSGSPGAKGNSGAPGQNGGAGARGEAGVQGVAGESVEIIPGEPASCAGAGGVTYEAEGIATPVCNGKAGSPWAVGGLPAGVSEYGSWSVGRSMPENISLFSSISFNVPLAAGHSATVHFINVEGEEEEESVNIGPSTACTGNAANPTATPGNLCIYESTRSGKFEEGVTGHALGFEHTRESGFTGAILQFFSEPEGSAYGTWVVTAPTS
jgi:hypothetical protein